jgi:hypothetical protein
MTKITNIAAAVLLSLSGVVSAAAADNSALSAAGLSLSGIAIPSPETPKSNQWMTLRKITVNQAQPDMNDTLVGLVAKGENIDKVVKELTEGGFKVKAMQDNHGGYMIMADVTGLDAADYAIGLARYYYITEVQVGQKVHNTLFGLNNKSVGTKNNQWLTLRKIKVNEAQPDMENTLVGLIERGQDIDKAVKELNDNGFKASPLQDNLGGYMVMVDVTGLNAADYAVGLARYYYVTEVKVSQKVHNTLFGLNN